MLAVGRVEAVRDAVDVGFVVVLVRFGTNVDDDDDDDDAAAAAALCTFKHCTPVLNARDCHAVKDNGLDRGRIRRQFASEGERREQSSKNPSIDRLGTIGPKQKTLLLLTTWRTKYDNDQKKLFCNYPLTSPKTLHSSLAFFEFPGIPDAH